MHKVTSSGLYDVGWMDAMKFGADIQGSLNIQDIHVPGALSNFN